ncbi:MAG: hypothetical protein PHG40_03735 [Candidatus Omnitrophica bacterium]|nr:hypothetical protein [Candidatus Omnitrophota bacterium]
MEIIVSIIIGVVGIAASWYITRKYYLKSLHDQREEFLSAEKDYRRIIEKYADKQNADVLVNKKLLEEKRITDCINRYVATGGGEFLITMIDTYSDLSNREKADLLDMALLRAKGRKAKDNPFRNRDTSEK